MDPNFWHSRWEDDQIAFHTKQANPLLVEYFSQLSVEKGSRVLVPLCGKTLDMRKTYTSHLMKITETAPQLLICCEYNQALMDLGVSI